MIVGADGASDATILSTSASLYSGYSLKRVYYSAFSPIPDASRALPLVAPPLAREHRLYQADWLFRFYGFGVDELTAGGEGGMLDLSIDPKLAWALRNRGRFPIDVNTADRDGLLRVPGLGKRTVDRIVAARRHRTLRLEDIARLCGAVKRARPFLITGDHRPGAELDRLDLRQQFGPPAQQLSLFG
jgi:predicted DNA-binding helix-hairpin-helix protein